ncbi:hypothetical protein DFS34DRAFT_644639 [Phlyctochytrium arcticum]|nr:hypothetical protein DFS34DRAFT_644639 [Phlyctochytrium arcticum]
MSRRNNVELPTKANQTLSLIDLISDAIAVHLSDISSEDVKEIAKFISDEWEGSVESEIVDHVADLVGVESETAREILAQVQANLEASVLDQNQEEDLDTDSHPVSEDQDEDDDEEDDDADDDEGLCALCTRSMPLTFHHLYPRQTHSLLLKRNLITTAQTQSGIHICRPCHSAIHRMIDNKTLAREYASLEALMGHEGTACEVGIKVSEVVCHDQRFLSSSEATPSEINTCLAYQSVIHPTFDNKTLGHGSLPVTRECKWVGCMFPDDMLVDIKRFQRFNRNIIPTSLVPRYAGESLHYAGLRPYADKKRYEVA